MTIVNSQPQAPSSNSCTQPPFSQQSSPGSGCPPPTTSTAGSFAGSAPLVFVWLCDEKLLTAVDPLIINYRYCHGRHTRRLQFCRQIERTNAVSNRPTDWQTIVHVDSRTSATIVNHVCTPFRQAMEVHQALPTARPPAAACPQSPRLPEVWSHLAAHQLHQLDPDPTDLLLQIYQIAPVTFSHQFHQPPILRVINQDFLPMFWFSLKTLLSPPLCHLLNGCCSMSSLIRLLLPWCGFCLCCCCSNLMGYDTIFLNWAFVTPNADENWCQPIWSWGWFLSTL